MSGEAPTGGDLKMRANREVIQHTCVSCGKGFQFGEEVSACAVCGRYQHAACWETREPCPHRSYGAEEGTTAEAARLEAPVPEEAQAEKAAAVKSPPPFLPAWKDDALVESFRKENDGKTTEELLAAYKRRSNWFSEEFFESIRRILLARGVDPSFQVAARMPATAADSPAAAGPPAVPALARPPLGPDEMYCWQCSEVVKSAALKCRFCNAALDRRSAIATVPAYIAQDIEKNAGSALTCGIVGLFVCAPVLGSMAISKGNAALRAIDQYPLYSGPRGKAKAGLIMGWVDWALFIVAIVIRVSAVSSR